MDDAQLHLQGNKEDVDLQLKGRGDGGSNKTKTKVRAMFLKLFTTMPYTTAFLVADGVIQARQRPPQAVAWDQHPSFLFCSARCQSHSFIDPLTISHSSLSIFCLVLS